MSLADPATSKRIVGAADGAVPQQRKRSRTSGGKDLYDGHSQDVMLAKTLIDPDHQCSVTTVKAYVTHVCAWFRFCRTLEQPDYTRVTEQKLSGFLTWATQTPRLPCKTGGAGGSMSYQSARRYVEGGILALWRRYKAADEENPLHALGYLNTKYAIREATAGTRPARVAERQFTAVAVGGEQEDAIVRALWAHGDSDMCASLRAWAYYVLGAATWIPGTRPLHVRLDTLALVQRTDARLVEHTTVPLLEFRVGPDPAAPTARYAEVAMARHADALVCPWFAVAALVFAQWQAAPSALALAATAEESAWLAQPLFQAATGESRVVLPEEARVHMVADEIAPVLAQALGRVRGGTADAHVIRRRDKHMAEDLGLSAPQVVRLERWRVHHRRPGVTRQQTFFDLALVLAGHTPPPPPVASDGGQPAEPHVLRMPARTRLQVPEHLAAMVFPWLAADERPARKTPGSRPPFSRHRSHSVGTPHSDEVARAERAASRRLMRELATVLLQDAAALLADARTHAVVARHPLFRQPLFATRAFRDFAAYAAQALSLQQAQQQMPPMPQALAPPVPPRPILATRPRRHTFETIREEDAAALAHAALPAHAPLGGAFDAMLAAPPLQMPPAAAAAAPPIAFPQLSDDVPEAAPSLPLAPQQQHYLMQFMDYLSAYNHPPTAAPPPPPASAMEQQHFPRLASESSSGESTASPELPANMPLSAHAFSSATQQQPALPEHQQFTYTAYPQPLYSRPLAHHHSFTAPSQLLLPSDSTAAQAHAAATATALAMASTPQTHAFDPLPLLSTGATQHSHSAHNLSMYFANTASPEYIDPASLAATSTMSASTAVDPGYPHQAVTPPHLVGLPKSRSLLHHAQAGSLASSLSPTPTPEDDATPVALLVSAYNPPQSHGLGPVDPASALQFTIAPHKLQFNADHDMLM
ncbi:hypothetical protein GGI15_003739 [Coemansia interrupta]|uniref:Ndc10 domain-containing protein n=1 Tax=Coemansia interrupta TaxID=1126814 RepID=A0A9W8HBA5_9FUNG|nr:hypothetical protein GGI15_003739 [Coemansia interrupta]